MKWGKGKSYFLCKIIWLRTVRSHFFHIICDSLSEYDTYKKAESKETKSKNERKVRRGGEK